MNIDDEKNRKMNSHQLISRPINYTVARQKNGTWTVFGKDTKSFKLTRTINLKHVTWSTCENIMETKNLQYYIKSARSTCFAVCNHGTYTFEDRWLTNFHYLVPWFLTIAEVWNLDSNGDWLPWFGEPSLLVKQLVKTLGLKYGCKCEHYTEWMNQPGLGMAHQHPARSKKRINALCCEFDCGGFTTWIDSIRVSHPVDVMVGLTAVAVTNKQGIFPT